MKNTRRLFALLLAVLMVLSALPVQAATAGCNHNWGPWQETGRSERDSSCYVSVAMISTCSLCGAFREEEAGYYDHNWGPWEVEMPATCIHTGIRVHECTRCGQVNEERYGPGDHKWNFSHETKRGDCSHPGEGVYICEYCKAEKTGDTAYGSHKFGAWHVVLEPTPTTAGREERECGICGLVQERPLYPSGTLFNGDHGPDVKELEERLTDAGYDCGTPDYTFDKKTEDAIKQFENDHGFPPDGIGWPGLTDKLGSKKQPGLLLEVESVPASVTGADSEVFHLRYTLTNIGELALTSYSWGMCDKDGVETMDYGYWDESYGDAQFFNPGDSYVIDLDLTANDADRALGQVIRGVTIENLVWVGADGAERTAVIPLEPGLTTGRSVMSNIVWVAIPIVPAAQTPVSAATLECITDTTAMTVLEGEPFTLEYRFTNTGTTHLNVNAYRTENPEMDYTPHTTEWNDALGWLPPGESAVFRVTYTADAADTARGSVVRIMNMFYAPLVHDRLGEYAGFVTGETVMGDTYSRYKPEEQTASVTSTLALGQGGVKTPVTSGTLELLTHVDGMVAHPGDNVKLEYRFTNTGNTTLSTHHYRVEDGEGGYIAVVDVDWPALADPLAPGESCLISQTTVVSAKDVAFGSVVRKMIVYFDPLFWASTGELLGFETVAAPLGETPTWENETLSNFVSADAEIYLDLNGGAVTAVKTLKTAPTHWDHFHVDDVLTYEIAVTNGTGRTLRGVDVYDPLIGNAETYMLGQIPAIAPGETASLSGTYTVAWEDAIRGTIENTAWIDYAAEGSNEWEHLLTNTVTAPVVMHVDPPFMTNVSFIKSVSPTTPYTHNNDHYHAGDVIRYDFAFTNHCEQSLHHLTMFDLLKGGSEDAVVGYFKEVAPGETVYSYLLHTVTQEEAEIGCIFNKATAYWYLDVNKDSNKHASNEVIVTTDVCTDEGTKDGTTTTDGDSKWHDYENTDTKITTDFTTGMETIWEDGPFGVITEMEVVKTEISLPANGSYYVEGETIHYEIAYMNTGETDFGECLVYDSLNASGSEIAYAEHMYAGDTGRKAYFDYTVTAADVKRGFVTNTALVTYDAQGTIYSATSNQVISSTGADVSLLPPEIPGTITFTGSGEPDSCHRELKARTEGSESYTLHFCAEHAPVVETVRLAYTALDNAQAKQKALQFGRTLLEAELGKLYDALLPMADSTARLHILNERIQFSAMLGIYEQALLAREPGNPLLAAERVNEMLIRRLTDLCYEIHNANEQRLDAPSRVPLTPGVPAAECGWTLALLDSGDIDTVLSLCGDHSLLNLMTQNLPEERAKAFFLYQLQQDEAALLADLPEAAQTALRADTAMFLHWLDARTALLNDLYPRSAETVREVTFQLLLEKCEERCR